MTTAPHPRALAWPGACLLALLACAPEASQGGPPPPPEVTVAAPLVQGIVEWDRYTGRMEAIETVEVRARVSGHLESIHFDEGQIVQRGDLLAVIDPRPFRAELSRAEAALEEARARRRRSEALVAQARAELVRASSALALAESRLENARQALSTNSIAKEQADVRESESAQAEAEVEAAQAAIASAEADIATSDAAIETATAEVERARLDLDYTRIESAITGRTSRREVTRGNFIQGGSAGGTLLTTIVSLDPIYVVFDANEQAFLKYMRLAQAGQRPSSRDVKNPVYVGLVDEAGYPHMGHMDFVDNRIDPNTGTIRGRAILRNEGGLLTPGLFATVQLPGSARYDAVLIPDAAIGANQSQRFVLVLDDEDRAQPVPVRTGPLVNGLRVVRSGLTGGERVVVNGLQRVRPGMVVSPVEGVVEADEFDDGLPDDYEPLTPDQWITVEDDPAPGGPAPAGDR